MARKSKANYVPNKNIKSITVKRGNKTTEIQNKDILDGAYVKKGVKFKDGGSMYRTGGGVEQDEFNVYDLLKNNYIDFYNKIESHPKVKDFDVDGMSGGFSFVFKDMKDFVVYATPFWEDEDSIPVEIAYDDGDYYERCSEIKISTSDFKHNYKDFSDWYYGKVDKIHEIAEKCAKGGSMYRTGGNVGYAWLVKWHEPNDEGKMQDILSNEMIMSDADDKAKNILNKAKMGQIINEDDVDINGYAVSYKKVPIPKGKKTDAYGFEYAKGGSMYCTGGVMGDIYSIQNAEQFKQLITTYNELSEKFGVVNYFLDHKDNSVAFLMQRDEESMSNTLKLQRYIDTLNDRGFDVFDKTKNKNIIIKEDNSQGGGYVYFKLKLSKIVRYADGGGVGQNVRGIAYYITSDSAGDDYRYLSGSFLSKEEFDNFYGDDAILDFYFNVNVEYDWQIEKAIYQQMLDEEVREEGIHIIGYKISRSDNDDIESNLPYDDDEEYANGGRLTSNADIIEAFLTSNREAKVGNLSTHYNEYDNEILLRNYGTLIASRKGNNLRITSTKYSITTTKITNMVNRMAKEKGLDVKYVEKFEDGGNASCWCYEVGGL